MSTAGSGKGGKDGNDGKDGKVGNSGRRERIRHAPGPDLAIKSITKNEDEWGTEFVARVTIINQGNAPVDKFDYLAKESFGGSIPDLGDLDDDTGDPLAPGETMKFNVGSARAHQNLNVEVLLDRHRRVEELDESNNHKQKTVN